MNALLLVKDLVDMIMEDPTGDVQIRFENKNGEIISTSWDMVWDDWNPDTKMNETIVVRL